MATRTIVALIRKHTVDLDYNWEALLVVWHEIRGLTLLRDSKDIYGQTRTVDVQVAHLPKILAGRRVRIETVTGVGYKLAGG
jgi:hypothetical protein